MQTKAIEILLTFMLYFVELSLLFIATTMAVKYLNMRFNNVFKRFLTNNIFGYFKAILLGALTPFCSCSTIPLFKALLESDVKPSICVAYLLTSPLLNPVIIAMFILSFGLDIAVYYGIFVVFSVFICSFLLSFVNSSLLIKTKPKKYSTAFKPTQISNSHLQNAIFTTKANNTCCVKTFNNIKATLSLKELFQEALREYKKIFVYLCIAMMIGAFLYGFVPQGFLEQTLSKFGAFSIVFAALIAILLHVRIEAIIPVGLGLIAAGVPLGAVMSFLIAGGGCSLPELILLKSIVKNIFLILFVAIILAMAIGFGLILYYGI